MAVQLRQVNGEAVGGHRPMLLSALPPEGHRRTPSDLSCVIDVSWSMSMEANVKAASGASESNGLSMLDIAKHAVRTVIQTLNAQDRLCIISFCRQGELVLPLTQMDEAGKAKAEELLEKISFGSGTALWQGLYRSFEELYRHRAEDRLGHTMLLTDGETEDADQLLNYLKESHGRYGGRLPSSVSTFGFGYEIDSKLLVELASACGGTYSFIPDAGFVGTIFVNCISNLLATCCADARLKVEPAAAVQQVLGGYELALGEIQLGALQYGQSNDVVLMLDPEAALPVVTLEYTTLEYTALGGKSCSVTAATTSEVKELDVQMNRSNFVDVLARIVPSVEENIANGKLMLTAVAQQVSDSSSAEEDRVKALLEDILGQCLEAVEKEEYWNRWGRHYVPSVMFAHKLQQCNNFKDPGVQCYGSELFADIRDIADACFNKLPAPSVTPARYRYLGGGQAMTTATPMSVTPASYGNVPGLGILTGNEVASAVGPTKVAGAKTGKQTRKKDDEANYTTIMLRNIPNKYSRQMLIDQLHSAGFLGQIDYLYLPIDFANRCNVGYCFINFRTSQARQTFSSMFDNVQARSCLPGFNSYKVCQVTKAKWQGRDENVRRIRSGPELMQQLAGHPDWLPVLLDEQGQQEPFLLDDLPGKQAAQKGRNNKKQILAPGALRPGSQVPGLSDLLEGARVGVAGKKNANAKTLQGAAKSKNTNKNKQPKGPDVVPHPMVAAFPQMQMQWLQAMATGCGVPMPMMAPGGLPMQGFMQPAMYDGVDSNVLMGMNMMPFPGGVDMSQYMNIAAFGQSYPYGNGDAFEQFGDIRGNENAEDEEGDVEEEDDPAMTPSYIVSGQPLG